MALSDWINRLRGHQSSYSEKGSDPRHRPSKPAEPPTLTVPELSLSKTPSNELVSPSDTEKSIVLKKLPQEFGCLRSWRGSLILLVTSGSQFLDNVFMTSSNMALASIQEEFKVSNTDLQWMISAYTLSFGGLLLLAGSLSDRYELTPVAILILILISTWQIWTEKNPLSGPLLVEPVDSCGRTRPIFHTNHNFPWNPGSRSGNDSSICDWNY
jgi:hypothetical protein